MDKVLMEIRDNGLGFDPACVKPTSLGLRMMRERAEIHSRRVTGYQPAGLRDNCEPGMACVKENTACTISKFASKEK